MSSAYDQRWTFPTQPAVDVNQRLNPIWVSYTTPSNFAGNAAIERRVVADVASYGTQIGWLSDIILELVTGQAPDPTTVSRLANAVKEIEEIKRAISRASLEAATAALQALDDAADTGKIFLHIEYSEFLTRHDLSSVLQNLDIAIEKHFIAFVTNEDPDGATTTELQDFFKTIPEHTFFNITHMESGSVILEMIAQLDLTGVRDVALGMAAAGVLRTIKKGTNVSGVILKKIIDDVIEEINSDVEIWLENRRRIRKIRLAENKVKLLKIGSSSSDSKRIR